MQKTEYKYDVDPETLKVANDIRPMLENNFHAKFTKYYPYVYNDPAHCPAKGIYSLAINIDLNKTVYVTVVKNDKEEKNKYAFTKLEVLP